MEFEFYNASTDLLDHNLKEGRQNKTAVIDDEGSYTYGELNDRVNRFANVLTSFGVGMEQRVLLCLLDTIDFPTCFLGAIKAGAVPIPVSTMLTEDDFEYMLLDSRAKVLVVSEVLLEKFSGHIGSNPYLKNVIVSGSHNHGYKLLSNLLDSADKIFDAAPTRPDDAAFWLYTSGTTGRPKGAIHSQTDLRNTAELYAKPILGVNEQDVMFSAAKLFFAYGLGNAMTFPFSVGATSILLSGRPTPDSIKNVIDTHQPSLYFGVPTLYAMMLNSDTLPDPEVLKLRVCVSAGEALPETVMAKWQEKIGVEILDGIGSTEMLHIYMSNRRNDVAPGTSGKPVPGYKVRIVDEDGQPVTPGEIGELQVKGPTATMAYWNQQEKSRQTLLGEWFRTGDKYRCDENGNYIYAARSDDLLKVGGIYVSPMEVENSLMGYEAVAEAAVVGVEDDDKLVKPMAYVTLVDGFEESDELAASLIEHVRNDLAEYKRPRWIKFIDELPKTATGKIQRFKLRN